MLRTSVVRAALAAAALAAAAPVGAQGPFGNVTVLVGGYEVLLDVSGVDPAHPPAVHATLADAAGGRRASLATTALPSGSVELAFTTAGAAPRRPVTLRPGDRVTVTFGDDPGARETLVLPIPALSATPDLAAGAIAGEAPPGAEVGVTAASGGSFVSQTVRAGADGRFSADFGGALALEAGASGVAYFRDGPAVYQVPWFVRPPSFAVGAAELTVPAHPGEVLAARLRGPDGAVRAWAVAPAWDDESRLFLRDAEGEAAPLLAGDRLEVDAAPGAPPAGAPALDVPRITVVVDPAADTVSGTGEPGAVLRLDAGGTSRGVVVEDGGAWSAAFGPEVDLEPDTAVTVGFADAPEVVLTAYAPAIEEVGAVEAIARGRGVAGAPVGARLVGAGGQERGRADGRVGPDGRFALGIPDAGGGSLALAAGDSLEVATGGLTRTVPASPLTARADGGLDLVLGSAAPGDRVTVTAAGAARTVEAGADGVWQAAFEGEADLAPGDAVRVRAESAGGHARELAFPVFRASVQTDGHRVRIEGHAGLEATVEVEAGGRRVGTGACVVETTTCDAVVFGDEDPSTPRPFSADDEVLVFPSLGETAAISVFPLTAHIDLGGRDVTGLGPPDSQVRVVFVAEDGAGAPFGAVTGTDAIGVYDHELGSSEWSFLLPGLVADVFSRHASGHQLVARAVIEVVRATPGDAVVRGLAEPGSAVAVEARAVVDGPSGPLLGAAAGVADDDGRFGLALRAVDGAALAVRPGLELRVTHQRRSHRLEVTPFAAWPLGTDGSVAGVASPGGEVRAVHRILGDPAAETTVVVANVADASGELVLAAPPAGRSARRSVELVGVLPGGDELRLPVDLSVPGGRLFLPLGSSR